MTSEEIRKARYGAFQEKGASALVEIAAQLAELVAEQRKKNTLLEETIRLQQQDMADRLERDKQLRNIFTVSINDSEAEQRNDS
jgi:hypothetical protein